MADSPETLECPSCGASLPHDRWAASVTCRYCNADVRIPRERAASPPPLPSGRHPQQADRDELASRIEQEEREWNQRIEDVRRAPAGEWAAPLLLGAAIGMVVFLIGVVFGTSLGLDPDKGAGAGLGCGFYLVFFLVPYLFYKYRQRARGRQALVFTAHREMALEPLRKRLVQLDKRIAYGDDDDPKRRRADLEAERREVSQSMDQAFNQVEDVRHGGSADLRRAPKYGCLVAGGVGILASIVMTHMFTEPDRLASPTIVSLFLGAFLVGTIGAWIVRFIRRKRQLALLLEARDAVIPDYQKQLDRIEAEIENLA